MNTEKITIGFVGLGLIGGSIAKSIRGKYRQNYELLAYDIDNTSLRKAQDDAIIDYCYSAISDFPIEKCNIIFLCAPVIYNNDNLQLIQSRINPNCILTDVGSVKEEIMKFIQKADLSDQFIGGHPMAGSEKSGFENSSATLLENAYYVLTPTVTVPQIMSERLIELIRDIGALPIIMTASKHDYTVAGVSHLPHIISASLVNLVKNHDSDDQLMKLIAAGGFKDITRISSSSPDMWSQISFMNKNNIISLLDDFILSLQNTRNSISMNDVADVYNLFSSAKEYREELSDQSSGPLKELYRIYIDLKDEPGVLANIVSLLAEHNINIKNIGISHNREFENGALRIEFYDLQSLKDSIIILNNHNYSISLPGNTNFK